MRKVSKDVNMGRHKLKKQMMRLLCALLCLCICLPCAAVQARVEETGKSETEEYRDRVLERYDQSFEISRYYENLQLESGYLYEQWAGSMEDMPGYADFLTSAADWLLDKKLNEEAYTEYLLKLMEMVEAGFNDTAASQAMYTARASGGDVLKGGITIVSKLLGATADTLLEDAAKSIDRAADVTDITGSGVNMLQVLGGVIRDTNQLAVV